MNSKPQPRPAGHPGLWPYLFIAALSLAIWYGILQFGKAAMSWIERLTQ